MNISKKPSTYTLTDNEAELYDAGDQSVMANLRERFGLESNQMARSTAIKHPEGFIVAHLSHEEV